MLNIITALLPIFIVIAFGYAATRAGAFTLEGLSALGRFVISIALPALIFKALSENGWMKSLFPPICSAMPQRHFSVS